MVLGLPTAPARRLAWVSAWRFHLPENITSVPLGARCGKENDHTNLPNNLQVRCAENYLSRHAATPVSFCLLVDAPHILAFAHPSMDAVRLEDTPTSMSSSSIREHREMRRQVRSRSRSCSRSRSRSRSRSPVRRAKPAMASSPAAAEHAKKLAQLKKLCAKFPMPSCESAAHHMLKPLTFLDSKRKPLAKCVSNPVVTWQCRALTSGLSPQNRGGCQSSHHRCCPTHKASPSLG